MRILLLFILTIASWNAPAAAPKMNSSQRNGHYQLVSGTDNCPSAIEWADDSEEGFALHPANGSTTLDSIYFGDFNKGLRILHAPGRKTLLEVVRRDNFIRKKETIFYSDKKNSLSLLHEDAIIHDGPRKFLWEHSRNGRGFSCLYSR